MTRALVLGGGGPVGIGWESGLIVGLAEEGIRLADADRVIGTSAGSVVGSLVATGQDLAAPMELVVSGSGVRIPDGGVEAFWAALAKAAGAPSPEEGRRVLGRVSVESPTAGEADYVAMFEAVEAMTWPASFACTAVDVDSGEPRLWEAADHVPLPRAVASSCSVPGIFPPVTIGGRRYMDGGMRTALNADLAEGHRTVIAVSCFALDLPPGFSDPVVDALNAQVKAELDHLRTGGSDVEVVVPGDEMLDISGWGLHLMDFDRAAAAHQAGRRQARHEAGRLKAAWNVA
jgi:NTE family protein